MDEVDYIGKIALSKENEKLGEIIRVEGSPTSVIISEKQHAIVKVKRLIFSPDYIELLLELVLEKTDSGIKFDISEEQFQKMQELYRADRKNKATKGRKSRSRSDDYKKNIAKAEARQVRRW